MMKADVLKLKGIDTLRLIVFLDTISSYTFRLGNVCFFVAQRIIS